MTSRLVKRSQAARLWPVFAAAVTLAAEPAPSPAPPPADWATVALFRCDALPLTSAADSGAKARQADVELGSGRFGRAFSSSRGAALSVAIPVDAQPADELTVECWINLKRTSAEKLQRVFGRSANYGFYVTGTERATLNWFVFAREWRSLRAEIPLNTWTHIAGTFDGRTMRLYVDGALQSEAPNPGSVKRHTGPYYLGAEPGQERMRFHGLIDEVRLSKIARTRFMTAAPEPRPTPTTQFRAADLDLTRFQRALPVPHVATPPTIDGKLDEPLWQELPPAPFVTCRDAEKPVIPTSVRVAFDDQFLYVAYHCIEKGQETQLPGRPERDDTRLFKADAVELFLQPGGRGTPYFQIAMNAAGGIFDQKCATPKQRVAWDAEGARVAGDVRFDDWSLEAAIPFADLGIATPEVGSEWRANFCRNELPGREVTAWSRTGGGFHVTGRFGLLKFVSDAPTAAATGRHDTELRGTILDEEGKPVASVPVRTPYALTRTDRSGEFRLTDLAVGDLPIEIKSPRYHRITGTVTLTRPRERVAPVTVSRVDPYRPDWELSPSPVQPVRWLSSSLVEPPRMDKRPDPDHTATALTLLATPGEYESRAVAFLAAREIDAPQATISALTGGAGAISAEQVSVRWTQRLLKRVQYKRVREDAVFSWRFLWPEAPPRILPGQLRQLVVTVHVPEDTQPGRYTGMLELSGRAGKLASLPVALRVPAFRLAQPAKRVGCYYRTPEDGTEQTHAELEDIRQHGGGLLIWHASVWYTTAEDGTVSCDVGHVERAVLLQQQHGIGPPYIVGPHPRRAAAVAGLKVEMTPAFADAVIESTRFREIYSDALRQLDHLEERLGAGEFLYTWMDEVFGRGRFEPWKAFAGITRELSDNRIYITFHNRNQELVDAAAPFVDVRCYHGHTLDWWIGEGHSWSELGKELRDDGDEAWTYYNIREIAVTSEWVRLCNGYWLWRSPLNAHVPWIYYACGGSPFDDLDADRHDFAYAAPHPDRREMVSTLEWECFREGYDDLRYLTTLEQAIRTHKGRRDKTAAVARGKALLKAYWDMDPRVPVQAEVLSAADFAERRLDMTDVITALLSD